MENLIKKIDSLQPQHDEWVKHIPNPFSNSKLSKAFWSLPKPINNVFIKEFELHNWDKQWLQDYIDAMIGIIHGGGIMFKELIKQIMYALSRSVSRATDNYGEGYEDGFKTAKDLVVSVIESYKPKVLDKPNSEGWWWNNAIGDWRVCQVHEGSGINGNDWDYPMWADRKGAKWIKVEMPEME